MSTERKPIRVWMDGCFDMMHWGHANALRQGKALGDILIVGVHSDKEIEKNKGPPVLKDEERYKAVEACKWCDMVVRDAPYYTSLEVLEKYDIDFCVHGDDASIGADGKDTYQAIKDVGKFRTIPRTIGVSTTDLVGRMLLLTKDHFTKEPTPGSSPVAGMPHPEKLFDMTSGGSKASPYTKMSQFLPSSRRIVQFSEGNEPKASDKIVYVDGAFDIFHIGHAEFLRVAKENGDYLIVGVLDDRTVNVTKGANFPIMNLHERVLGVLACRYVDEVIIGAPNKLSKQMMDDMNISVVCEGTTHDSKRGDVSDRYGVAKDRQAYELVESPHSLTTASLVERIIENRIAFQRRNAKKEERELEQLEQTDTQ